MTPRNRQFLTQAFSDGSRPNGAAFANIFDSFPNIVDDNLKIDASGHVRFPQGLVLGNSNLEQEGALRYNNGQVEFHNGDDGWLSLSNSSGVGAFQPVGTVGGVAYAVGNVGIGSFSTSGPTYRLEVELGNGDNDSNRVRFGAMVIFGNGNEACFAHRSVDNLETDFGFCQEQSGDVRINTPTGQSIRFDQGADDARLAISRNGNVIVGSNRELLDPETLENRSETFQVNGSAYKNDGNDMWSTPSDVRLKEDIRDLEIGLEAVMQIRPVRFRYNGKAGTHQGQTGIGIIGQEIETVIPETIQYAANQVNSGDHEPLRVYNGSALTYVLINAVKELTTKVQQLETELTELRQGRSSV